MKNNLRKIIYLALGYLSKLTGKKVDVFVLCYHGFSSDNWRFSTKVSSFKNQILELKKTHKFLSVLEFESLLSKGNSIERPSVLLTIDDGYKDIMKVREFLNEQGIKPVVFLLSGKDEVNRVELDNQKQLLSLQDIKTLAKNGWFFGSHGVTHSDFHALSTRELQHEVAGSKKQLEKTLNIPVNYFAFPKGRYSKESIGIVKKSGYKLAFSMDDGLIYKGIDNFAIPRIGIDGTHSFLEFKNLASFYAILFRKTVKKYFSYLAI